MPAATFSDAQIRAAMKALIRKRDPLSIVYPWFSLKGKPDTWPGQLTSREDLDQNDVPRVHGYVFTRNESGGDEEWKRNTRNCADRLYRYEIWAYHYWDNGREPTAEEITAGTATNSDLRFNKVLDAIKDAFNDLTLIQADLPTVAQVLNYREAPFSWSINLQPSSGSELVHRAIGLLQIDPR